VTPALAAGNVVMIKPSELVPSFAALLAGVVPRYFKETEMIVSLGGADLAGAFSNLPFDHLIFTGSTQVGRIVAEAAARNLTPVTLELGGKSPAIIDASANIAVAADRIAYGKLLNAGQTCVAPDYVLCASDRVDAFVADFKASVLRLFGNNPSNPDYTSIASDRHFDRLARLLDDAVAKGAQVVQTVNDPSSWKSLRKLPPCLILNTSP
jgi:coniferyl-aldehyde dehydrogenase